VEDQQILITQYTNPVRITNRNGVDLTSTTVSIAISQSYDDTPDDGDYASAEVIERTTSYIRVHALVDRSTLTDGTYYEWVRIDSSPEIIPERVATIVVGPRP
jgi:hypothetical protein